MMRRCEKIRKVMNESLNASGLTISVVVRNYSLVLAEGMKFANKHPSSWL